MLARIYMVFAAVAVLGYGGIMLTGYEWGAPSSERLPDSVRNSPGGYRTFHFWSAPGYRGGK